MTPYEIKLMSNPERKPFMDLPAEVQARMKANAIHLLRLRGDGSWRPLSSGNDCLHLCNGYIYKVDTSTVTIDDGIRKLTVFCGSDRIYKADLTPHNSTKKCIRYLVTVTGMSGFVGIRYAGSDALQQTVNIPLFGIPLEVWIRGR